MIRCALDLISAQRGERLELQGLATEDPTTYDMIGRADIVGVFQLESRAQLTIQPRTFYNPVIEAAIICTRAIQGGIVHPYMKRRQLFGGRGRSIAARDGGMSPRDNKMAARIV